MSRPRTVPDADVLEAAFRVMGRLGPQRFTLSDIAAEAGLAPATLIQRYGSKRGLLLAIARAAAEGSQGCFDQVRAGHRSPLKALLSAADEMAQLARSPEVLAHNLGFLQNDLGDPEFREYGRVSFRSMLNGFQSLLDDAVRAGELTACDTAGMARLIQAAIHGSLVAWGFEQRGTAASWVRRDVALLLRPYRTAGKKGQRDR